MSNEQKHNATNDQEQSSHRNNHTASAEEASTDQNASQNAAADQSRADSAEPSTSDAEDRHEATSGQTQEQDPRIGDERNQQVEQQAREYYDKYMRLHAEFDNFRRRTQKEKYDIIQQASKELVEELLPILDDFERALDTIKEAQAEHPAFNGVELIYHKFWKTLEKRGLKPIEARGEAFDPEYHEALSQTPAPTPDQKGKVVDVIEKGYQLNDKIIRHAKVVVGQ